MPGLTFSKTLNTDGSSAEADSHSLAWRLVVGSAHAIVADWLGEGLESAHALHFPESFPEIAPWHLDVRATLTIERDVLGRFPGSAEGLVILAVT